MTASGKTCSCVECLRAENKRLQAENERLRAENERLRADGTPY
jgi:cell division protein FtsB